jgi:hypothetical protein
VLPVALKLWQPICVEESPTLRRGGRSCARVLARHALAGELLAAAAAQGGEQRRVLFASKACSRHIGVEILLEQVIRRHFVLLAAFLVQADPLMVRIAKRCDCIMNCSLRGHGE